MVANRGHDLDWTQDDTEVQGDNTHLWEESWDDDDTSEDFSAQLKYGFLNHSWSKQQLTRVLSREELKKVEASKR
jgi:DSS1/SEM1 family